jgi:hypothetical protein
MNKILKPFIKRIWYQNIKASTKANIIGLNESTPRIWNERRLTGIKNNIGALDQLLTAIACRNLNLSLVKILNNLINTAVNTCRKYELTQNNMNDKTGDSDMFM